MAQKAPDAVKRLLIDPVKGAEPGAFLEVARAVGLEGKTAELAAAYFEGLCRLFEDKDASLIEINPLALFAAGGVAPESGPPPPSPVSGGPAATATVRDDMSSEINSLDSDLNLCYEKSELRPRPFSSC